MRATSHVQFEPRRLERRAGNHRSPAADRRPIWRGAGIQAVAVHGCGQQRGQATAAGGLAGCSRGCGSVVEQVDLMVSDGAEGVVRGAATAYAGVAHRLCLAHGFRGLAPRSSSALSRRDTPGRTPSPKPSPRVHLNPACRSAIALTARVSCNSSSPVLSAGRRCSYPHASEGVEESRCSGGLRPPPLRFQVYRRSESGHVPENRRSAVRDRRYKTFFSHFLCHCFIERLEEVRQKMHCLLIGWVLIRRLTDFHTCTTAP